MANTRISNAAAIAALDTAVDLLDAGSGAAYIEIRTGSAPTNVEDSATGTLLGTLTCSDPAFGDAADAAPGASATAASITGDSSADATGTAGYFRAYDSDDTPIIQGDISASGGGGDMQLNTVSIVSGAAIEISSWVVTMPET